MARYIRWFEEITLDDLGLVGGKNASLGEMWRSLRPLGVKIPPGFAITGDAYWSLLDVGGLRARLTELMKGLDLRDTDLLARRAGAAREIIENTALPAALWDEIRVAYDQLQHNGAPRSVAVRSSATAEDLPGASFAGQQESFLNVSGHDALRLACSRCFASLFTDRAISYRTERGFDHMKVALSIGVQRMVRSDTACAGVMFTLDTETGFRDVVLINAAWGLGENLVKGSVDPDEFYVFKPTLASAPRPILRRRLGLKQLRMIYTDAPGGVATVNVPVPEEERGRYTLTDAEVLSLARTAVAIEGHYSQRAGQPTPMDIEWAKDGPDGELFIVQARPETVEAGRSGEVLERHLLEAKGEVLVSGTSVGQKIGSGAARVIRDPTHLASFVAGEVLVADTTTPDWEPVMKRSSAIVTERGGRTCHAAIVARELGIPAIVGATGATSLIEAGAVVTVCCAEGDVGRVYRGALAHRVERVELGTMERPRTKIMMNVADPDRALSLAALPNDGVGLARIEFIINNTIRAHPMALLHPERVLDAGVRAELDALTRGYSDRGEFFVDQLAQGVGTIAAAFYPKPVVVRLSDFKSNEYASLLGGRDFEFHEENPMIGLRGASRYTHPSYAEAFALECRAMRRVREDMGLTNVELMIPFCRRVAEGERVLAEMAKHGLRRGERGLKVLVMCEIPNNVVRIDAFCALFDGISIGSNDLTQLTLGVDRDSALVAFEFDERDPGVLEMLRQAVTGARRNGKHSAICGQAPSDHPDVAAFLVELGIDALSLNPDSVLQTTLAVLEIERAQGARKG
ncbi:MAG: phosphoenolpyruvate synthase [Deltaproteobacteria bacterium]|nr:phosphoenolpyruvate synthase [Deltaproteobacteria bacterium]